MATLPVAMSLLPTSLGPWIALLLFLALVVYGWHPIRRWRYRHLPGPRPVWLLGSLHHVILGGLHHTYQKWGAQYGPVYRVLLGGSIAVVVTDPAAARKAARKSAVRAGVRMLEVGYEKRFNEYGILLARESLAKYMPLMTRSADTLAGLLGHYADTGEPVDVWRQLGRMTLDVVGSTAFGVDFHTMDSPEDLLAPITPPHSADRATLPSSSPSSAPSKAAGATATGGSAEGPEAPEAGGIVGQVRGVDTPAGQLAGAINAVFNSFDIANLWLGVAALFPDLSWLVSYAANLFPTPLHTKNLRARKVLRRVATGLLDSYRQDAAAGAKPAAAGAATEGKGVDPGSFLALQTRAVEKRTGAPFPDDWVISQAYGFILAGYETTANALAASIHCLAAHPDKEGKLLAEVDAFGRDRHPGPEDMQAFPYAEAVWKEALRLFPPGSLFAREATQDFELAGHFIPKGTLIHGDIYTMQRDPQHWRDPEAFIPERFLPGAPEAQGSNLEAWMPFGEGARKCIGYGFATQEGVLTLVRLYQQLVFRLTPGQVPLKTKVMLTHGPAEGVRVTVHRRE